VLSHVSKARHGAPGEGHEVGFVEERSATAEELPGLYAGGIGELDARTCSVGLNQERDLGGLQSMGSEKRSADRNCQTLELVAFFDCRLRFPSCYWHFRTLGRTNSVAFLNCYAS
jgi:hypothetical protein